MQETKVTAAEAMEDEEEEEEEGYVKVGTRFYRVTMRPTGAGGAVVRRRLHYLESCYLCKESIACDRDVFMYKYVRACHRAIGVFLTLIPSLVLIPCSFHHTRTPWWHGPWRHGAMACGVPGVLVMARPARVC